MHVPAHAGLQLTRRSVMIFHLVCQEALLCAHLRDGRRHQILYAVTFVTFNLHICATRLMRLQMLLQFRTVCILLYRVIARILIVRQCVQRDVLRDEILRVQDVLVVWHLTLHINVLVTLVRNIVVLLEIFLSYMRSFIACEKLQGHLNMLHEYV